MSSAQSRALRRASFSEALSNSVFTLSSVRTSKYSKKSMMCRASIEPTPTTRESHASGVSPWPAAPECVAWPPEPRAAEGPLRGAVALGDLAIWAAASTNSAGHRCLGVRGAQPQGC
jgi:hypothetical protein